MSRIVLKTVLVMGLLMAACVSSFAYLPVCPAGWCTCTDGNNGCCGRNSCSYSGGSCKCT
jgi:hypothetical protein